MSLQLGVWSWQLLPLARYQVESGLAAPAKGVAL
jgi:hypothetical protein